MFIKVYRSLDSFDERSRFSTWLYRVTRNTCLDQVRAGQAPAAARSTRSSVTVAAPGDFADEVALSARSRRRCARSRPRTATRSRRSRSSA